MLQLLALHRSTAVPVVGCEGGLPAIQNLPQFLELIEAHGARHVPLRLQPVKDPLRARGAVSLYTHCEPDGKLTKRINME